MFRKSILASTLSLLMLPGSAWALGLGGIRAESALNQPFVGEIDLVGANPDQLDAVKVVLASEEEYAKRGTERQPYLSKLRFKPQVSPRGKTVVRVTGTDPIREPYMDFLVEVIWPKGRLVKGYTVLLDPPVTKRRSPPPVEPPLATRPATAPPVSAPPVSSNLAPRGEPAPVVKPPAGSAVQPVAAAGDETGFPLRSGPVKPGSGLWRTARNLTPPGATVAQTAMALYRNNQQAFVRGDINKLRKGTVLGIPTSAELFAMDPATAEREFRTALAGKPVTAKPLTDVAAAASTEEVRLKIAGAAQAAERRPGPTRGQDGPATEGVTPPDIEQELLLVRESGESTRQETGELRERVRQLESNLTDIQQLLTLSNAELARLRGTHSAQGGATPTPSETARSESESAQAPGFGQGPTATDVQAGTPGGPQETAGGTEQVAALGGASSGVDGRPQTQTETGPTVNGGGQPTAGTAAAEGRIAAEPAIVGEQASSKGDPLGPTPGGGSQLGVAPAEPGVQPPLESAGSWLDAVPWVGEALKGVPGPVLWSAAVATPVLGVLALLAVRRRRRIEESLTELNLPSSPRLQDKGAAVVPPMLETTEALHEPELEEPALPESSGSVSPDPGRAYGEEDDESDVMSEADIYIAYGRYREAESLLQQAIGRSPKRVDLRYKLADVYVGARNSEGLAMLVDDMELAGMDRESPEQWNRLVALVKAGDTGATAAQPSTRATAAPVAGLGLGGLDLGGPAPAGASGRGEAPGRDLSADLGFATPVGEVDSTPAVGGDSLAVGDIRPQDFNFGFEDLDLGRVAGADDAAALGVEPYSAPEPYPVPRSVHTGDADLELTMADLTPATEFDLAELGVTTPTSGMPRGPTADLEIASPRDAQHGPEFGPLIALDTQPSADLAGGPLFAPDSGHAWADLAPVPGPAPVRPERGFGGGPEAARFDIEAIEQDTDSNDLLSSQWQMEGGIWDEVATKLDLGRAYVAMDDPQAAQAILVEVAEEGNPEQQAEAREILAQLKSN